MSLSAPNLLVVGVVSSLFGTYPGPLCRLRIARLQKIRQEAITPLDAQQARLLLEAARGDRFASLYVLSLMCGLRMGESLGLKWSDIDFDAGTLRVHRQVQRIREGGGLVFSEPKNASRRTIDLPKRALEALRSHRKRQVEQQA